MKLQIRILMVVLALAAVIPASAQARHHVYRHHAVPGSTGKGGGTNARRLMATATTSVSIGRQDGRNVAGRGLAKYYGGQWRRAFYKDVTFKARHGQRLKYEYVWVTGCCSAYGSITVWKSPFSTGYAYYYAVNPGA